ncbi:MAG: cell division protein FtsZ [Prevotellaceae bacterium]|jgi:cell division protein FtsZ|nr:cell division protein FtsZ [Prevotellaceae bacterium]
MNEVIPLNWDKQLSHLIKVIGVGGGGNNAVKNMYEKGIEGVDFIICNTDAQVLDKSTVPVKIQLGAMLTKGLGTGCNPEIGRQAALESLDEIKKILESNTEMIFIATGLGGGTGTGAAPIIAKEAKSMGILTVAIVTLPFKDEGEEPYKRAIDGLQNLRKNVDSLLIINNEKLYEIYPELSVFEAFPKADDVVATAAKSIAEIITVEGYINVDLADVKMVMKDSDMALMGLGRAAGENRVQKAAEQALLSPLLNNNDISGAKNILVNVSSGLKNPLKTYELKELMSHIINSSGRGANFKRGVTKDISLDAENSDAEISVTIIATGFSMNNSFPDIGDDIKSIGLKKDTVTLQSSGKPQGPEDPHVIILTGKPSDSRPVADTPVNNQYYSPIDLTPNETIEKIDIKDEAISDSVSINRTTSSISMPGGVDGTWSMKEADITMMEQIPAYERQEAKVPLGKSAGKEVTKHWLGESGGTHILNENNSYLNRDVD